MKKSILFTFVICVIVLFPHCEKTEGGSASSNCGTKHEPMIMWHESTMDNPSEFYSLDNGKATFSFWTQTYNDVCSKEHVKINIMNRIKKGFNGSISFYGECMYGILYAYPVTSWEETENDEYYASYEKNFEVGLKASFGDSPGWFMVWSQWIMEDQGSDEANIANFVEAFNGVRIDLVYYDPKVN